MWMGLIEEVASAARVSAIKIDKDGGNLKVSTLERDGKKYYYYVLPDGRRAFYQDFAWADEFYCGIACVKIACEASGDYYFFIRSDGTRISPCTTYDEASRFHDGLACMRARSGFYHYIATNGDRISDKSYKNAGSFHNGLALVQGDDDEYFFININEENVFGKFKKASSFSLGLACVQFKSDDYGYIRLDGSKAFSRDFRWADSFTKDGFACVKFRRSYGYINLDGEKVFNVGFKKVKPFVDGVATARLNNGNWAKLYPGGLIEEII
ncbi:MAG: WG repeat-containing protein [Pseudomonadales bacterium]|nr:WG repeat-containing protein [Pseudomonadales bacterium]